MSSTVEPVSESQMNGASPATGRRKPRIFYGWWLVITAVLLNIVQGGILFYGFTLIIGPMSEEMNWSRTQITIVFPILGAIIAVLAPILGWLFDRVGPRPLVGTGMVALGGGLVALNFVTTLPMFYVWFALANVGSASMWLAVGPAVANWFVRQRGRALGVYTLGYALAGVMALPFYWLIETAGWRSAFLIAGLVFWLLTPIAVFVIRHRPENQGLFPDGADGPPPEIDENDTSGAGEIDIGAGQALRTRAFWLMALGSALAFLTIAALQVHWVPYMESVGFTRTQAAFFLPLLPLSTVVGRLGMGFLADLWDKKRVTALAFALQAVAVLLLALVDATRPWIVYVFLGMWGIGFGGTIVTRMALQGYLFGRKSFGTLQGMLSMTSEAGFAFSPVLASLVFEGMGSYRPVFFAFAALALLAAPLTLAITRPRSRAKRAVTPADPAGEEISTPPATR